MTKPLALRFAVASLLLAVLAGCGKAVSPAAAADPTAITSGFTQLPAVGAQQSVGQQTQDQRDRQTRQTDTSKVSSPGGTRAR